MSEDAEQRASRAAGDLTDQDRVNRMPDRTGDQATVLADLRAAQELLCDQDPPIWLPA